MYPKNCFKNLILNRHLLVISALVSYNFVYFSVSPQNICYCWLELWQKDVITNSTCISFCIEKFCFYNLLNKAATVYIYFLSITLSLTFCSYTFVCENTFLRHIKDTVTYF